MAAALAQARLALDAGEVPIGAVLVIDDQIVASAFNQPIGAVAHYTLSSGQMESQVCKLRCRISGREV